MSSLLSIFFYVLLRLREDLGPEVSHYAATYRYASEKTSATKLDAATYRYASDKNWAPKLVTTQQRIATHPRRPRPGFRTPSPPPPAPKMYLRLFLFFSPPPPPPPTLDVGVTCDGSGDSTRVTRTGGPLDVTAIDPRTRLSRSRTLFPRPHDIQLCTPNRYNVSLFSFSFGV